MTSEQAATMLREFVADSILGRLAEVAGPRGAGGAGDPGGAEGAERGTGAKGAAGADYRAALVASQVLGLALTRYVIGLEPLAAASQDDLAAAIGPTLERYLTGEVR
jgi:hypothetical protein